MVDRSINQSINRSINARTSTLTKAIATCASGHTSPSPRRAPSVATISRSVSTRARCSSWPPCDKFKRMMFIPAATIRCRTSCAHRATPDHKNVRSPLPRCLTRSQAYLGLRLGADGAAYFGTTPERARCCCCCSGSGSARGHSRPSVRTSSPC